MERALDSRPRLLFRRLIIVAHLVANRLTCAVHAVQI